MKLANQTVLVTGAAGNLGPYVISRLLDDGAEVIGTYLSDSDLNTDEYPEAVTYYQADLTDQVAVESLAETVNADHGGVDHIVGLAGGFSMGGIDDTDAAAFEAALSRHATTAFLTVRAFADQLDDRSGIVLFSSDRAIDATAGTLAYNVGKGAVRTLAESLNEELDARVNAVAPFLIDVPGNREAMPDADFSEWTAAEAVADEVLHQLTNEGVAGQTIRMTGGQPEVAT
ncbi:SDR family NAD(P)-dependent oxidoreductase [Salinigranum salinum]|uniref:SDR family NAD(P)-dependent oxidoreductase n=1 Tax=Salinigranum salinum TaxID=1364937 RepID=UPI001260B8C7|nr:SDR family NAD(P)-dependent oxidoreductase [Salinigranum salinum]